MIHLNTTLNLRDSSFDVDITTVKSDDLTVFYSVLPSNDLSTFLTFPFKECANRINQATDGLNVFHNPFFKFQDEGEELQGVQLPDMQLYLEEKKLPFESVLVNYATYKYFKEDVANRTYKKWLNDQLINFFSRWSMRNISSKHVMASEIIDTIVSMNVKSFFEYDFKESSVNIDEEEFPQSMHQIHTYLNSHVDLLSKKFIFFTNNDGNQHWWGWVAINPWYHMVKVLQMQEYVKDQSKNKHVEHEKKYVCGLLACDGMNDHRNIKESSCFIWFLNLALAYRDMMVEGVYTKFSLANHSPRSYWIMGCNGPFGIIDELHPKKLHFPIYSLT